MSRKNNPVLVRVQGNDVKDLRIFTSTRKLNTYLKSLNKNYNNLKINIKSFKAN